MLHFNIYVYVQVYISLTLEQVRSNRITWNVHDAECITNDLLK